MSAYVHIKLRHKTDTSTECIKLCMNEDKKMCAYAKRYWGMYIIYICVQRDQIQSNPLSSTLSIGKTHSNKLEHGDIKRRRQRTEILLIAVILAIVVEFKLLNHTQYLC